MIVVGHSYIHRLQQYVRRHPQLANFGLRSFTPPVKVHYIGVGGATVSHHHCPITDHLHKIPQLRPYLIFLHIGENDLGRSLNKYIISDLTLIHQLSDLCHSNVVIVSHLISFLKLNHQHRCSVQQINKSLMSHVARYHFWRHSFGRTSHSTNFASDNVHLNQRGLHLYWRSLRTAIGRQLQHQLRTPTLRSNSL